MIHNRVYIFHRVLSDPYSDIFYTKSVRRKLSVCCKTFGFFKAIVTILLRYNNKGVPDSMQRKRLDHQSKISQSMSLIQLARFLIG